MELTAKCGEVKVIDETPGNADTNIGTTHTHFLCLGFNVMCNVKEEQQYSQKLLCIISYCVHKKDCIVLCVISYHGQIAS